MSVETTELKIRLTADGAEDLEALGIGLKNDLNALPDAELTLSSSKASPSNAKSIAGIDWSQLLVTLAASGGVLTTLIGLIQARLGRDRKATLQIGEDKLELSGLDSEDQRRLIDAWVSRQRSKSKHG